MQSRPLNTFPRMSCPMFCKLDSCLVICIHLYLTQRCILVFKPAISGSVEGCLSLHKHTCWLVPFLYGRSKMSVLFLVLVVTAVLILASYSVLQDLLGYELFVLFLSTFSSQLAVKPILHLLWNKEKNFFSKSTWLRVYLPVVCRWL